MNTKSILESLILKEIIPRQQAEKILEFETQKPFSIHWELRSILYLGISLLTSGLGILVYENIDTIGHQAIITVISALIATCFYYVYKTRQPFQWSEINQTTKYGDYSLLFGCTLFLILEGYLQFQYNFFGTRYGIAIFIPTLLFFLLAYRFDHRGVLSMAITGLASWLGITISPMSILTKNDFSSPGLIATGTILGLALCLIGWLSETRNLKKHFAFTYLILGGNLAAVTGLTGVFNQEFKIVYLLIVAMLCLFLVYYARNSQSLIFLLMGVIYGYFLISYSLFAYLPDTILAAFSIYYFMLSSVGVLFFLLNVKKILGLKK
ncbi:DUF2157 domain-containing protein [Dyadobacter sp. CY345]|uniref:DUF2157 domain-containing protein n=1 Tax=Dyadobacter sp. CY345 TaxID=2909335 RepID=UPI001F283AB5|nr:DUF2157 domain-containing protein [Dyadobacter sp. CY345]MCF2444167.1 DUF2157 domain-containing protein [Dyadobacter sp. CY345]